MTAPIPRDLPDIPAIPGIPKLMPSSVPASAVMTPLRRPFVAVFRLMVALAAAGAAALAFLLGDWTQALCYFSVQSAILLALTFAVSARRAWTARRPVSPALTGAVLLYAAITTLVFHLLPSHLTPVFALPLPAKPPAPSLAQTLANHALHTAVPLAAVADWLFLTTPGRLHLRQAAAWMVYPVVYLAFTLARGALLSPDAPARYLYPFLDVDGHGYKHILGNALLLGLSFYALAVLLIALDHARPNPIRHHAKTGFRLQPPVG
ncbi:Pr6Pr family membrane protein [Streptomyces mangrovisoli]|uniref:Integral membrane regulator n=1 Tax=Streptomyces mangrovisoli TaxID=1428628 RepID=A0A1J4P826_9ACTN|nr:Pr6Pr family membrane protein [Streptomyces mangrovisoli]OIJ69678.1 integral membrane regulator [Streptomyces mangrovisoli]